MGVLGSILLVSSAHGASCPTKIEGTWVVSSYYFDSGVVAVSGNEARKVLGKTVSIQNKYVDFPGEKRCEIRGRDVGLDGGRTYVTFDCANGVVIPSFSIDRRCGDFTASLDGANYRLVARRPR